MVNPIPDDYPRISMYLCVDNAEDAIEFYKSILGADERVRYGTEDMVGHSELTIGDSLFMVSDEFPDMEVVGPKTLGGTPCAMNVYVDDVDTTFAAALEAGAIELQPVSQQFYGDRSGKFKDPWGHRWIISTRIENVEPDEIARRVAEKMSGN